MTEPKDDFKDVPVKTKGISFHKNAVSIGIDVGRDKVNGLDPADAKLNHVRMDVELKHDPNQGDDADQMTMGDETITFASIADTGQLSLQKGDIGLTLSFSAETLTDAQKLALIQLRYKSCTMTSKVIGNAKEEE